MALARPIDFPTLLSVEEAQRRIVDRAAERRVPVDTVPLDRALGRVLAIDVAAPQPIPPFANSAMDGYAVRSADLPASGDARLHMVGVMLAGSAAPQRVGAGECIRITTGAPIPDGADTVVIKENVRVVGDDVLVRAGEPACGNVRPIGEDVAVGDVVVAAGETLDASRLGLLATCGCASVRVARRPRVALIVTGDELVPPGEPLGFGQIHDSNRFSLGGLLEGLGIVPEPVIRARDDVASLREALLAAAERCDAIVTSGGVSAGEADHLPDLLNELGRVYFWKVRIKPGLPFICGEIGKALVFGLPGNPVSSFATFLMLVRPALKTMQGAADSERRWFARLAAPVRKKHDRTEFLRGVLSSQEDGTLSVTAVARQGSGMMSGVAGADCLIAIPSDVRALDAGAAVEIVLLSAASR